MLECVIYDNVICFEYVIKSNFLGVDKKILAKYCIILLINIMQIYAFLLTVVTIKRKNVYNCMRGYKRFLTLESLKDRDK